MNLSRKLLMTLGVFGTVASVAGAGTFSAFSGTTENAGSAFAAGTVTLADNDAGTAVYNVTNRKPGEAAVESCVKVSYTGSLPATVKMYAPDAIGSLGSYLDLTVTAGTGNITGTSCANFVADAGSPLYSGTLANFKTTNGSYDTGISDNPGTSATQWVNNDSVVYKFSINVQDNNLAQGLSTGSHSFKWEARNN